MKPRERQEDISVGQLVNEHFGSEVLEYLTEPLLCGVYGGESENLSAESVLPRFMGYERKYGSLVKGVQQELRDKPKNGGSLFLSFRDGMQTLTDSLAAAIRGRTSIVHGEATAVTRSGKEWHGADWRRNTIGAQRSAVLSGACECRITRSERRAAR